MIIVYSIFAVIILIAAYFYLKKEPILKAFKKEKTAPDDEKTLSPVLARIYDRTNRKIYNKMVDGIEQSKIIKEYPELGLGRQWNKDGKWMFALCREFENTYIPVEKYLTMERENPPSKLHSYLSQPEIEVAKDMKEQKGFMEKYGHYLPYLLAILFLVFIMVMQ